MPTQMTASPFPQRASRDHRDLDIEHALTYNDRPETDSQSTEPAILNECLPQVPSPTMSKEHIFCSHSLTSSISTVMAEKYLTKSENCLPAKKYGRVYRNIRWTILSVYRRLNLIVILINIIIIITLGAKDLFNRLLPERVATAIAVNITAAILIRQELVINLLFVIFGMCPRWMPLRIRRLAAKIYHLGGVHSGAGISATIWFAILNAAIVRSSDWTISNSLRIAILTVMVALDVLLVTIVILSHPTLRSRFHNAWEAVHRFAGWTAIILFWSYLALEVNGQQAVGNNRTSLTQLLAQSATFWCLLIVTISLALPWLRLRKVTVHAESLSDHAVRLHFTYTNLPLCAAPRLSDSPLKEWHAFAGIPEEDGNGFSVLVSKAGDWTARLIQSPPTKIWTKGIPVRGVLHIAPIFNRVVLVATGSGIGPILSLLYARNLNCRIVWSTPDPLKTYREGIIDQILLADPDAIIINTTRAVRPDLVKEAYQLYKVSEAEAVFVISNPKVTRKVVYGLESRGIPTFAPIFDS